MEALALDVDSGWSLTPLAGTAPAPTLEARRFEGHSLRIEAAAAPTLLHLHYAAQQQEEAPLLAIELAPGARCVLLETHGRAGGAATVQNLQLFLRLGRGAQLQHLRAVQPGPQDRVAHQLNAHLEQAARYEQALLATGSAYHQQRVEFELQGEDAEARIGGVLLAAGSALEQQVQARHAAARTRSTMEVLALASGTARVEVSARTHIAAGSSDAETRQRLAGIPTGGQPRLLLRPHLEIHHDQVQAAHGATWGALPEEALFLARQRGIAEAAAKALILEGLARAALTRAIDDTALPEPLRLEAALRSAVAVHLGGAPALQEVSHG